MKPFQPAFHMVIDGKDLVVEDVEWSQGDDPNTTTFEGNVIDPEGWAGEPCFSWDVELRGESEFYNRLAKHCEIKHRAHAHAAGIVGLALAYILECWPRGDQ